MAVDPFKSFEAALPSIIAENPSQVIRYREHLDDTFRHTTDMYTAGPYAVRIEPYKAATAADIWDEKGNVAHILFQMVGYNLPPSVEHEGAIELLDAGAPEELGDDRLAGQQHIDAVFAHGLLRRGFEGR